MRPPFGYPNKDERGAHPGISLFRTEPYRNALSTFRCDLVEGLWTVLYSGVGDTRFRKENTNGCVRNRVSSAMD